MSHLEVFFNKGFACFQLCWIEGIDLGNLGSEIWAKFNSVVIGTMRGKLIMGFLREDILEVLAPIGYNWFGHLGGLGDLGGNGGLIDLLPI